MNTNFSKRTTVSALAIVAVTTAIAPAYAASSLEAIKERGYVRAATANEVPYGFMDTDGSANGIAPEVAEAVFKNMGIEEVQWVVTPFGSLIPGLKADRFDIVAGEHDILPERCQQILFSEPNSSYGDGLLVKAGNPSNLHSYEDIAADPALRLAVVNGTSHLGFAEKVGVTEDQLVVITSNADAPATIASGRADAYAAGEQTVRGLVTEGLDVADPFSDPVIDGKPVRSYGGFGFQQGSEELVAAFNEQLAVFKRTPEYLEILTKYGLSEESIASSAAVTTAELCAR